MNSTELVTGFKLTLLRKVPFYGDVVARLKFEPSLKFPVAATDGYTVYYNPSDFERRPIGECYFVLMHEVMHVILRHAARNVVGHRDTRCWNVACDLVVNQMLLKMMPHFRAVGIKMQKPPDGLFENVRDSMTVENLYTKIAADQAEARGNNKSGVYLRRQYIYEEQQKNLREIVCPADLCVSELSPEQRDRNDEHIRQMLRQVAEGSRSEYGSFPIPDTVYALLETRRLHWKTILRSFLTEEISDDSSYTTPERKYLHMDLILPGHTMSEETLEEVWVFVDSSGSISHETMRGFLTELYHLVKQFSCRLHLVYWDTCVTEVYRNIRSEKEILECLPKHSGGTDINCVYRWIREQKVRPSVMLILTDGYYGRLSEELFDRRLSKKTVLILDSSITIDDEMRRIGKTVRLAKEETT